MNHCLGLFDLLKVSNNLQKHWIDELVHYYKICPHSIMYFTQHPPNIEWEGPSLNEMHSGIETCFCRSGGWGMEDTMHLKMFKATKIELQLTKFYLHLVMR